MSDTPQLARLKRTRDRLKSEIIIGENTDRILREMLVETSACIHEEEQKWPIKDST
jgi:hypothetical protein